MPSQWCPEWLALERRAQGLTIEMVAARAGVPSSTVANAEKPGHGLRVPLASRIARRGLGVTLHELAIRGGQYAESKRWPTATPA